MSRTASAVLCCVLAGPAIVFGQPDVLPGVGIVERLEAPSQLVRARNATGARSEPTPFVFVQLIVPRDAIERSDDGYTFEALDARIGELEGSPVLLALDGMPATTEDAASWQSYVLAISERYRGRIAGYVLGRSESDVRQRIETYAYLLKLAAVQVRTANRDAIVLEGSGSSHEPQFIDALYDEDVAAYVNGVAVTGGDELAQITGAVARRDPSAQVIVTGVALGDSASDVARKVVVGVVEGLARGSRATSFEGSDAAIAALLEATTRLAPLFGGNVTALDAVEAGLDIRTSGEPAQGIRYDLLFDADSGSTLLVYWAESEPSPGDAVNISLRTFIAEAPALVDSTGATPARLRSYDYDLDNQLATVEAPLLSSPLILVYASPVSGASVTATTQLDVAEIVVRHQQAQSRQDNLVENYFASVRDEIHFRATTLDSFDVILESRFYSDREGSEWEELSFSLNGARWGSDRPAFPLLQPEKVMSLPLDLQLDQDYAYELEGRERLGDRECYVVRFRPVTGDRAGSRSLYAGRVWIDAETFVKLKVDSVQTGLSAPVVSNAEVYTYEKQADVDGTGIYLLSRLQSQQLVLIAGRNLLVEKISVFYDFHVNSSSFDGARETARTSDHIMLRDTDEGLRYFVKQGGVRQVSDELTRSAKALALGVTVDPSFDFPLPIVGLNYLDFDFLDRNAQFALLFGGIFALGNIQKSNLWGGSFDTSFDFFGIAIQSNDIVFNQQGEVDEASLRTLPASMGLNLGWQFTDFQKLTARYDLRYDWYGRAETTVDEFVTPMSTLSNGSTLGYEFRRRGYSLLASGSYAVRANWEPWGDVSEFDPDTKSYWKYRVVVGKDFFFKTFHKIHIDGGWFGGDRLDRFTAYQFGLFDETRVRGVPSTAVRFKELILARASYSFNVFDQFRFELFYDRAWGDDPELAQGGVDRVNFSGLGIGLNVRGPWDTIVRVDVSKSFLPEALRGAGTVVTQFLVLKPL